MLFFYSLHVDLLPSLCGLVLADVGKVGSCVYQFPDCEENFDSAAKLTGH